MNDSEDTEFIDEEESDMGPAAIKKLREKLQKAVEEKQDYLDKWQRGQAEFANFKRQEALINADRDERNKADLIESLLPALDALELSLKHEETPTLKMLERQFLDSLKRLGVEKFGAVGEEFNPHLHEALAQNTDEHKIVSVERSGYKIDSKVIRPAQVLL
jgi:molecular chaperone GrpE